MEIKSPESERLCRACQARLRESNKGNFCEQCQGRVQRFLEFLQFLGINIPDLKKSEPEIKDKDFFTASETAAILRLSKKTILEYIRLGHISSVSFRRKHRIPRAEIDAFKQGKKVFVPSPAMRTRIRRPTTRPKKYKIEYTVDALKKIPLTEETIKHVDFAKVYAAFILDKIKRNKRSRKRDHTTSST